MCSSLYKGLSCGRLAQPSFPSSIFLSSLIYGVHLLHQHILLYITAQQSLLHTKNEYWTSESPCTSYKCLWGPSSIKLAIVNLDHTNHSMFKTFPDVYRWAPTTFLSNYDCNIIIAIFSRVCQTPLEVGEQRHLKHNNLWQQSSWPISFILFHFFFHR